jgi:hypothetical protein
MPMLTLILAVPALAGLLCLLVPSRRVMAMGAWLTSDTWRIALLRKCCHGGQEWNEFLCADALSAGWCCHLGCIISIPLRRALFQRDLTPSHGTPSRARIFVLTAVRRGMFRRHNNLGVMWFAVEGTAFSRFCSSRFTTGTSLEAVGTCPRSMGWRWRCSARSSFAAAAVNPSFNWSHLITVALADHGSRWLSCSRSLPHRPASPMHTWLPDAHSKRRRPPARCFVS